MINPLDPEKLRTGDAATVAAYRAVLSKHIRRFFFKPSLVDDTAGAALVEIFEKLERGEKPKHPFYWALNAANNAVRRELTRMKNKVIAYESRLHTVPVADQSAVIEARDELARLDELLAEVDDVSQQVLVGVVQGHSHEEIANDMGIKPGTSRQSLSRVRTRLKDQLSARERFDRLRRLSRQAGLGHKPSPSLQQDESSPVCD